MTSCPAEEDLVLFVEDALDAADAETVGAHLVGCAECRRVLARSEAALRYALGGLADRERAAVVRPAPKHVFTFRRAAVAAALVASAAAATLWLGADDACAPSEIAAGPPAPAPRPVTLDERLDALLARADALAAAPGAAPESHAALAALAAAEARLDLGFETGAARLEDVVERFPGTVEAREARARLASLGGGR